jgi:hypothetical protein
MDRYFIGRAQMSIFNGHWPIGGSAGGAGLFLVLCCYKLCKKIAGGSCINSRTRVHVEIGDEKSAYRFKSDASHMWCLVLPFRQKNATFHIQFGDQSKLPGSVAKGDNTGLPKETTSETPTKIEVKSHADPDENPVWFYELIAITHKI